jgi:hypothetical protein
MLILAILLLSVSLALSLGITIPFIGTLIRFRANFSPKSVHLDQEGGLEPHVGPVVTSYWAMFKRIKRIEVSVRIFVVFLNSHYNLVRESKAITKDSVCFLIPQSILTNAHHLK